MKAIVVTGFLGAGKTTLVNWILSKTLETKIAVVLNEFGDEKLESQFVKKRSGEVIELANGCICCVAKSDLPRVINYIYQNSPDCEYVVIEASGLSDPDQVKETLGEMDEKIVVLWGVIGVVDVLNFEEGIKEHPLIMSQVSDSDFVVLSKDTLSSEDMVSKVREKIEASVGTGTEMCEMSKLEIGRVLAGWEHAKTKLEHHHIHEDMVQRWWADDRYISEKEVRVNLSTSGAYRAKGYFYEKKDEKKLVSFVNGVFEFVPGVVNDHDRKMAILLISKN